MTGNPLELFRKFVGAARLIFWLWGSFLAPEFLRGPDSPSSGPKNPLQLVFWALWTENQGAPKRRISDHDGSNPAILVPLWGTRIEHTVFFL